MSRLARRSVFGRATTLLATLTVSAFIGMGATSSVVVQALHPAVKNFKFLTASQTPPTETQCYSVGRRCFTPTSLQNSYNLGPLYAAGEEGQGMTIAVVDSYGSDTIRHDLHVFDTAFGLPAMCGEEGVACSSGMPRFSIMQQGNVNTNCQPGGGTGQESHCAWALEASLDVEWAHAMAPLANVLLIATPTAETLGVQGVPQFIRAEDTVITRHEADVISQSFATGEDAFPSTRSLLNLRYAFIDAKANKVTMFGSSGDFGSAEVTKTPVSTGGTLLPDPGVWWPASDPLVTGVGGTYLCTDAVTGTSVDSGDPPSRCQASPGVREIGWIDAGGGFSHVFSRPSFQDSLPAGSTAIPASARGVPDIASQASSLTGVLVYITNPGYTGISCPGGVLCSAGWYVVGGTSASSPEWAAMTAIADQISRATFGDDLGYINPALYAIGANPARYAADFYDVTTGNNGAFAPDVPGYPATQGWDPVTGLGTPNAAVFLPDLVNAVHGL
jgi:subtilase family serine protease